MSSEFVYHNELLAYVIHHMQKYTVEDIKNTICNFYNEEEIWKAKSLLWETVDNDLLIGKIHARRGSSLKTAHRLNVDDIVVALQKLDEEDNMPVFYATNFDRIPRFSPGETDIFAVLDRLNKIEDMLENCKQSTVKNANEISNIKGRDERDVSVRSGNGTTQFQLTSMAPPPHLRDPKLNITSKQGSTYSSVVQEFPPLSAANKTASLSSLNLNQRDSRDDQRKQRNTFSNANRAKQQIIFGNRKDASCTRKKGLVRRAHIKVFNIDDHYTMDEIKADIEAQDVQVMQIERIENSVNSFHIAIPLDQKDIVFSADFWPDGIGCRRYWLPQKRPRNKEQRSTATTASNQNDQNAG